ncbi:unnamed protein product [Dibothriocephalus latus]|uniref:Uncharacterized protein n=1 Tax=Dibothriocephalus latus TaxID=60516 RepID=A0A3P6VF05_DIBLA|nr:unnamed protein product [Dibothriocephalus latus]
MFVRKSFDSLDQFTANLLKEYSIPEDFTEIPLTTVDGVPLSSLPADCLKVVFDALSHLRESTEWNPAYISVFKFLCLLARNLSRRRDNRPHLLVYEYLEAIDNCSRDFLQQVLKAPSQCEEAARAFQLTSTFLEWVFDPEMTWRTWSEAITRNRFPPKPVVPSKGNAYSSAWLRDLLVATAGSAPLNFLQYALHLVCTECATSTVAAWSTISSALVTSLLTAFATADEADNRRNLLIICATFLIERLSQTDTIHVSLTCYRMD